MYAKILILIKKIKYLKIDDNFYVGVLSVMKKLNGAKIAKFIAHWMRT